MHRRCYLLAASSVHYTTSCKHSLVLLKMGETIARNMLSWLKLLINYNCCYKFERGYPVVYYQICATYYAPSIHNIHQTRYIITIRVIWILILIFYQGLMWTKWDPIEWYFYCTLIVVLSWPEDGRSRPKHVTKYHLTVVIASCLDVRCVLTVHNIMNRYHCCI